MPAQALLPTSRPKRRLVERALGPPAQLRVRKGRVGPDGDDVALAAGCDPIVELQVIDLLETVHQFEHRDAAARADVEDLVRLRAPVPDHAADRGDMRAGQIHHVDIVADARSVGSRVVVAEDRKALAQPGGRLRDIGHEVLRHAARQLADQGRGMRADGVEIAQGNALHPLEGSHRVAQDVFAHLLGVAVGRGGRLAGRALRDGLPVRFAVNGARRREDDVPPPELAHQRDDVHERGEVVAVIFERLADRLVHGLRRGEMDHRVELVPFEDPAERFAVAAVGLDEGDLRPRDAADPLDGGDVAVRKVIDDDHVVARGDQLHGGMRSDVAAPPLTKKHTIFS